MNYEQLVKLSVAYADREDIEVNANVDNFIVLAEARMNRLLRTRKQTARAFAPAVDGQEYYCLPSDYAGMRDVQVDTKIPTIEHSVKQYHYLSPEQMNMKRGEHTCENWYTVIANNLHIWPTIGAPCSIEMVYYRKVPNLNEDDVENWMSEDHPDIYLAGVTGEIELFAKNPEIAEGWFNRMSGAIADLENFDVGERWAGQALVTRIG